MSGADNTDPRASELSAAEKRELLKRLLRERAASPAEHPLSYNQRSIWFMHLLAPESPAYNVPFVFRPLAPIDLDVLRRVFKTLLQRHAILRTSYSATAPVQRVSADTEPDFVVVDAAGWADDELWEAIADEAHTPFDLISGPVLRVRAYVQSGRTAYLVLTLHHIAYDLWSMATLLNELRAIYRSEVGGDPVPPLPARQYADFVRWQAQMIAADGDRQWKYWREQLAGPLPVLELPADHDRPAAQSYYGATYRRELPAGMISAIQDLARAEGATVFLVLLTAYQLLLHGLSGGTDLVVGTPSAGRSRAEFESLVGYFLNTLPLRSKVAADVEFRRFLEQMRQSVRGALDHQDYPVELLAERLRPSRSSGHSTIFQTMFVLNKPYRLEPVATVADRDELSLERVSLDLEVSQFDLSLQIDDVDRSMTALWEYNTDLFDAPTIAQWADRFERLLKTIVDNPVRHLSALIGEMAREAPDGSLAAALSVAGPHSPAST